MHNAKKEVEDEGRLSAGKFLSQNSKSILEICFSSILVYAREREKERERRESLRLFQYTFKSVIATSKEIDLGNAECCHQSIRFPPSLDSASLLPRVFDSLLMARTRRNSDPLNVSRATLRAVFSYQHGLKLSQLLMLRKTFRMQ